MKPGALRLLALAALAGLTAAAWAGFRAAGADYAAFWLKSGPLIGLGTAALGWAWAGIDRHRGLISADPLDYAGSCLQAAGLPLVAFGAHLRAGSRGAAGGADLLLAAPLALALAAGALGWLLLIAPAQYFLFLVAGAPARLALRSRAVVHAGFDGPRLVTREVVPLPGEAPAPKPPEGWWDASMRDRPFAMTSAFLAASLFLLDLARGG